MRIALDAARDRVTWLVLKDRSTQEIVGPIQIQGTTARFTNRVGVLLSVKLADVDFAGTERFNDLVKSGRWVDPSTAAWSKARVSRTKASAAATSTRLPQGKKPIDAAADD